MVVILDGPSSAGKTTLARALQSLWQLTYRVPREASAYDLILDGEQPPPFGRRRFSAPFTGAAYRKNDLFSGHFSENVNPGCAYVIFGWLTARAVCAILSPSIPNNAAGRTPEVIP